MKRTLIVLGILLSVGLAISSFVYAADTPPTEESLENHMSEFSSSYIDDSIYDTLEELGVESSAQIVKVYNIPVVSLFARYSTIGEVMSKPQYSEAAFYVIRDRDSLRYYDINCGLNFLDKETFDFRVIPVYFNNEVIKTVSPDIIVYNVYYLSGATNYQGTALYYETDMGDYIYYMANEEYLMPRSTFVDCMTERNERSRAQEGMIGATTFDMSKYQKYNINSSTFDPSILSASAAVPMDTDPAKPDHTVLIVTIIAASVAAMAAVSAVLILRKRKTRKA